MLIDLLNLSRNAIDCMLRFNAMKTQMRMRGVCKSVKKLVEFFLLDTKTTMIYSIELKKDLINDTTDTQITFCFEQKWIKEWDFYVWRSCFRYFPQELDDVNFWSREDWNLIAASMNSEELKRFLDYLKPLLKRAVILNLDLTSDRPEVINMCLPFLESITIPEVSIRSLFHSKIVNFAPYLQVIKQVKPRKTVLFLDVLTKDGVDFVLQLADLVSSIRFSHGNACTSETHPTIDWFIREIMMRKCENIEIIERCPDIEISCIEKLVQLLQRTEKKFYMSLPIPNNRQQPVFTHIGAYKLFSAHGRLLVIKHLEM